MYCTTPLPHSPRPRARRRASSELSLSLVMHKSCVRIAAGYNLADFRWLAQEQGSCFMKPIANHAV